MKLEGAVIPEKNNIAIQLIASGRMVLVLQNNPGMSRYPVC